MKIVRILGGLGNQMFQYSLYLALKHRYEDVSIDLTRFEKYKLHNGYELGRIFDLNPIIASYDNVKKLSFNRKSEILSKAYRKILKRKKTEYMEKIYHSFDEKVFNQHGDVYFQGYWQNENYFKEIRSEILETFNFPPLKEEKNKEILSKIKKTNSVSIHVRRGDYLKHSYLQGICTPEYYAMAINYIKENIDNPVFFVFSNDIEWCENEFKKLDINCEFINWNTENDSYKDMLLMTSCKSNIIANSTFSWWGAWLNRDINKIVIAPAKWTSTEDSENILPMGWIRI